MALADARHSRDYGKILLIRTDRVGDLVLSTPAIASFRRSWPRSHIAALVTEYTEPIMRYNPDIDRLHILPRNASRAQARALVATLARDANLAVALAPRTDDVYLAGTSGAAARIGYVYRRRYFSRMLARLILTGSYLSDADPAMADRFPDQPVTHEVRQVLALVSLAGGAVLTEELVLRLGAQDVAFAKQHVPARAATVTLAPRWFAPNFGQAAVERVIRSLAATHKDVVVTFGNETIEIAQVIRSSIDAPNVVWLSNLPLLRWAAVLAQAGVVVTVDTGATHVAAALKVPVVVIFEREYYRLCSQEWSPWRVPSALLCKPPLGADPGPLIEDVVAAARTLHGQHEVVSS